MNDYVIKMIGTCLDGTVTDYDGTPITPVDLQTFGTTTPNVEILDDGGNAYPDVYFRNRATAPVLNIAGVPTTGILAGSHPTNAPFRPK